MSNLQPFEFEGEEIRFVGDPDKPECVGADMVAILYPEVDTKQRTTYLRGIPEEWKGLQKMQTPGGEQEMVTLKEPGIYALIARSNSPKAVPFQKWMFEDVIPTIRKTGGYQLQKSQQPPTLPMVLLERRERLEQIQLGMDLFAQLGGIDERTELQVKDMVRDIVLADKLKQPVLESGVDSENRLEYPISDRLIHLGYGVQSGGILKSIGQIASNLYKARYGKRPPQREQFVDGTTRMVRLYSQEDLDIVDKAIEQKLGNPKI